MDAAEGTGKRMPARPTNFRAAAGRQHWQQHWQHAGSSLAILSRQADSSPPGLPGPVRPTDLSRQVALSPTRRRRGLRYAAPCGATRRHAVPRGAMRRHAATGSGSGSPWRAGPRAESVRGPVCKNQIIKCK